MACARPHGIRTGPPGLRPRLSPAGRHLLAFLVLYAVALQSVFGGLAMAAAAGPAHVLCLAGDIDRASPDDPHGPAHNPMACCIACHAAPAALPAPAPAESVPALYPVALIRARPARNAVPRAPPEARPRARAPPPVV